MNLNAEDGAIAHRHVHRRGSNTPLQSGNNIAMI